MVLRRACVAGTFYPAGTRELESAIRGFLTAGPREKARAVIAPHAGYVYSGHVAGAVYSSVIIPDDVILIGPNHTGAGPDVSVMKEGVWEIPFGKVPINEELAGLLLASSGPFKADTEAHAREHSLEVQLPFLYLLNENVRFVPVTIMDASYGECLEMGEAIARAVSGYGKEVLVVVSSDMNHYEPDGKTREKDRLAIERVLSLDAKGLIEVSRTRRITMCGLVPAAVGIMAAKGMGGKPVAELVKYATSAEVSGDYGHVVGYAGVVLR